MTNYEGVRVGQLIDNPEFSFNVAFRICEYVDMVTEEDEEYVEGETIVLYDNSKGTGNPMKDVPEDIKRRWISAINTGEDGVMEIEFVRLIGEDYPA